MVISRDDLIYYVAPSPQEKKTTPPQKKQTLKYIIRTLKSLGSRFTEQLLHLTKVNKSE